MNFPVYPVLEEIEAIADLGMDYVELAMDPPQAHFHQIKGRRRDIQKTLNRLGLGLVCHLPTFVQTADLIDGIRQASVVETIHAMETAADLSAEKVVLHPSYISGMAAHVPDQAYALAMESLDGFVTRADQLGLPMGIENMLPGVSLFVEPEDFKPVFDSFGGLQLVFDIGHAAIGDKSGRRMLGFIHAFSDRMMHVHVSDNHGTHDEHLCVGHGQINFKPVIRQLRHIGYDETITLEIFDQDRKTLTTSRQRILKWL